MNVLLLSALLAVAPAPRVDVCDACRKTRLCRPHAKLEKAEVERLGPELESDEARVRISALEEVAALTEAHENVAGPAVAKVLAAALDDPSLQVRIRAVRLLTDGQHPETTVVALVDLLGSFKKNMWSLAPWLTGPNGERGTTLDAMDYLETTLRVSGRVRDDRVARALADVLLAMPAEMRGQPVAMAATRSLLELGTRDATRAVLRQLSPWSDSREMRNIHDALRSFASRLDANDVPEFGKDAPSGWKSWLEKHSRKLASKLGKWKGKPVEKEEDDGDSGRRPPGADTGSRELRSLDTPRPVDRGRAPR